MFANNCVKFLMNMVEDGELKIDVKEEIVAGTLVAHDGDVPHPRIREILGMEPLPEEEVVELGEASCRRRVDDLVDGDPHVE